MREGQWAREGQSAREDQLDSSGAEGQSANRDEGDQVESKVRNSRMRHLK